MPARSSPEWEQIGTNEPDTRHEDGTASGSPLRAGYVEPRPPGLVPASSFALSQPGVDPQPYNPSFQVGTGLTDWLNVLEFGAHNDNTAANATVGAIQAANLIAVNTGQLIYFPAGKYNLGGQTVTLNTGVQYLLMGTVTSGSISGGTLVNFGSSGMANPMTTTGDLIIGGSGGTPLRLAAAGNGAVLTLVGGSPAWASSASAGFANPMTTPGDLITGGVAGAAGRLAVGTNAQVLTVSGGAPTWQNAPSGFANPMTTSGDLISGGTSGTPGRLAVGANAQVLTVVSGAPAWANSAAGFSNPMTTSGDLITGGSAGAAQRLAAGSSGQVLGISSGAPAWVNNPAGFANPMLTAGDMITATTGGTAQRVAIGTPGQVLTVSSSNTVSWATPASATALAGPSTSQPTVFQDLDGSIVVLPLSFYGLTGDDSTWINTAFTFLPVITGGSSKYGGNYTGPWTVGKVKLAGLPYKITSGIVIPDGATVHLEGQGPGTILFVGSGATGIYCHALAGGPQINVPALQTHGSIRDMRIDGSAGAAVGIDLGGGWGNKILDVAICNFEAAGAIGLHLNNARSGEWTEKSRIRVDLLHCTNACVIERTDGTNSTTPNSMEYNEIELFIIADDTTSPAQTGVTLKGGCFLSGGHLWIRGNFPANSGPVLAVQGNDGNGTWSKMYNTGLEITVENNSSGPFPQNIFFGNINNTINNVFGILSFQFANFTNTNGVSGQLQFGGVINNSADLVAINAKPDGWL